MQSSVVLCGAFTRMAPNGKKEKEKKKKILTSTVTLNTGQQLPLAFYHVARETSETISSTVQKDLQQIQQVRNMVENHKGFLQAH